MAGILSVQQIQGLATAADPTTVEISSGHTFKPSSNQIAQEKFYTYSTRVAHSSNTLVQLFPDQTFVKKYDGSTSNLFVQAQIPMDGGWSYANAPYVEVDGGSPIYGYGLMVDTANSGTNSGSFNKCVQFMAPLTSVSAGSHTISLHIKDYNQTYYGTGETTVTNPTNSDDARYPATNYSIMTVKEIMI
jgi:hypothetical protein